MIRDRDLGFDGPALVLSAGLAPNLAASVPSNQGHRMMDETRKWLLFNVSGGGPRWVVCARDAD